MVHVKTCVWVLLLVAATSCKSSNETTEQPDRTLLESRFGMEFQRVPGGSHVGVDGESHQVESFFLQTTELTFRQMHAIEAADGSEEEHEYQPGEADGSLPAPISRWQKASDLAVLMSRLDDQYNYRLPTEAEWIYACAAGADVRETVVDEPVDSSGEVEPILPAKSRNANAFGFYDMLSNLGEYCVDACEVPEGARIDLRVVKGMPSEGRHRTYSMVDRKCVERSGTEDLLIGARYVLELNGSNATVPQ